MEKMKKKWYVYIVECVDGTFYTGITTDLHRRVLEHNQKIGSKSLRGRLPVKPVHTEIYESRSEALKREYEIKQLKRKEKIGLIEVAKLGP